MKTPMTADTTALCSLLASRTSRAGFPFVSTKPTGRPPDVRQKVCGRGFDGQRGEDTAGKRNGQNANWRV